MGGRGHRARVATVTRWWIGWVEAVDAVAPEDMRPRIVPVPHVVAWWCSGIAADGHTMCAVVDAPHDADAHAAIRVAWSPVRWRFCDARAADWMPPPDRFPPVST